jgi:hypothetical protein
MDKAVEESMWRTMELLQKQNAALMKQVEELSGGKEINLLKIKVEELERQLQLSQKQLSTSVDLLVCFQSMTPHIDSFLGKLRVTNPGSSSLPATVPLRPAIASTATQTVVVRAVTASSTDATTSPMQQPPHSISQLPSLTAEAEAEAEADVEADDSGSALLQLTPSNIEGGLHISSSSSTPEKSGGSSSAGKKRKKDTTGAQQTVEVVFLDPPHGLIARYANLEQASELSGVDLHLLSEVLGTNRRRGPPPEYSGVGWRFGDIADRIDEYSRMTLGELVARATAGKQAANEMDKDRADSNTRSGVAAAAATAAAAVGVQPLPSKRLDIGDVLRTRPNPNPNLPLPGNDEQLGDGEDTGPKRGLHKGGGGGGRGSSEGGARPVARHREPVFHGSAPGVGIGQKLSMMPILYPNDGYPQASAGVESDEGEEAEAAASQAFVHPLPPPPPPPPQAKRPRPMSRENLEEDNEAQGGDVMRQSQSSVSFSNTRHRSGDVGPPRLPTPHHKKKGRPKAVLG